MRLKIEFVFLALFFVLTFADAKNVDNSLTGFPKEYNPVPIGNKLVKRFLEQSHSQYGSPLRNKEPRTQITYPDVCVWLGGLWFSKETGNTAFTKELKARFDPLFTSEAYLKPKPNHVDNNVFGALALEFYKETGDKRYKKMGMLYADMQWNLPEYLSLDQQTAFVSVNPKDDYENFKQKLLASKGYSWQTRFWLDDMFMITSVQAQAYRVTKDTMYINRAAREMVLYLDSIQQPSGLFYHSPTAPYCWARGNGWMAVGMAELLRVLPVNHPLRSDIMNGFQKMMSKLKDEQSQDGMWRQLVDDPTMWEESSGTAMFTYAMIVGVKKGWLDENEYGSVARKGWLALTKLIDQKGDVKSVCEGTDIGNSSEYYRSRRSLTGDLHGQAPVLWCAYALVAKDL